MYCKIAEVWRPYWSIHKYFGKVIEVRMFRETTVLKLHHMEFLLYPMESFIC